jgi:hypothetical protein
MTNADIIFNESQRLAKEGIIGYTGKVFIFEDADGNQIEVKETEPIHTFAAWKQMGYKVKKGEKAVAQFTIWKHKSGKVDEETGEQGKDKMFMKKASFFTREQVEAIA